MTDRQAPLGPHLDADACLDLVHGLLDDDARGRALAHAGRCAACDELLRATVATHERGRARRDAVLAAAPAAAGPAPGPRATPRAWAAAAAVLAIAAAGWWGLRGPTAPPRAPEAVLLPSMDWDAATRHRGAEVTDSTVASGVQAYARGDLERAVATLEKTTSTGPIEATRRAYLASAQVRLGRCADALATLSHLQSWLLPDPWREETEWTRLVALARCGHAASADSTARELARGLGPVAERAARFLAQP